MTDWLLDTNIISETFRFKPDRRVMAWIAEQPLKSVYICTMNLAELAYGVARLADPAEQKRIRNWVDGVVRSEFADRTLDISEGVLLRWRFIAREQEQKQAVGPPVDLLIAAVAAEHGLGVATRDVGPFVACGVPVINPWTGQRYNGA